jgi:hypothetical protein
MRAKTSHSCVPLTKVGHDLAHWRFRRLRWFPFRALSYHAYLSCALYPSVPIVLPHIWNILLQRWRKCSTYSAIIRTFSSYDTFFLSPSSLTALTLYFHSVHPPSAFFVNILKISKGAQAWDICVLNIF